MKGKGKGRAGARLRRLPFFLSCLLHGFLFCFFFFLFFSFLCISNLDYPHRKSHSGLLDVGCALPCKSFLYPPHFQALQQTQVADDPPSRHTCLPRLQLRNAGRCPGAAHINVLDAWDSWSVASRLLPVGCCLVCVFCRLLRAAPVTAAWAAARRAPARNPAAGTCKFIQPSHQSLRQAVLTSRLTLPFDLSLQPAPAPRSNLIITSTPRPRLSFSRPSISSPDPPPLARNESSANLRAFRPGPPAAQPNPAAAKPTLGLFGRAE